MKIFVASYDHRSGIYMSIINEKGQISTAEFFATKALPSFFAQDGDKLFVANKASNEYSGGVSIYDTTSGLGLIDEYFEDNGISYNHLYVLKNTQQMIAVSYQYGAMSLFSYENDKIIKQNTIFLEGKGRDVHHRQEKPHPHFVTQYKKENLYIVCDLGCDALRVYEINGTEFKERVDLGYVFPKTSGPRHLIMSKDQKVMYIVNEISNTVTMMNTESLPPTILSEVFIGRDSSKCEKIESSLAAIHLSDDEEYLYVSNRNFISTSSLAIIKVAKDKQSIKLVGTYPVDAHPRDFVIKGKFLFCASMDENNVASFEIDGYRLTAISKISIPSPVCVCIK